MSNTSYITDEHFNKLQNQMLEALYKLKHTVDEATKEFEQESGRAVDTSYYLEDMAVGVNELTQIMSVLGFFEVIKGGEEPLP